METYVYVLQLQACWKINKILVINSKVVDVDFFLILPQYICKVNDTLLRMREMLKPQRKVVKLLQDNSRKDHETSWYISY